MKTDYNKDQSCISCTHYRVCKIIDIANKDSLFKIAFGLPEYLARICKLFEEMKYGK